MYIEPGYSVCGYVCGLSCDAQKVPCASLEGCTIPLPSWARFVSIRNVVVGRCGRARDAKSQIINFRTRDTPNGAKPNAYHRKPSRLAFHTKVGYRRGISNQGMGSRVVGVPEALFLHVPPSLQGRGLNYAPANLCPSVHTMTQSRGCRGPHARRS